MVTAYNREVQDKVTQINSVPSSLPSDVEADVCNSWATYSENQKHLRSVLIYKHALLGVAGLSDPVLQLVRADQSANDAGNFSGAAYLTGE
ncbi:hypothetical protein PENSUB_3691 [Penicillium subrubescens]|uniref:Uncharacterized protein n=1 Tax=Penicillium subrubescens TaxID=1316194 RepID=A0A1Q5UEH2_9EURO|nr:hypothetical protein PENSUB_3691 [Penicillium subrubescens]